MAEGGDDYDALLSKMDKLQTAIDAIEGWELDRQLERAMQALRCPPGTALIKPTVCHVQEAFRSFHSIVLSNLTVDIAARLQAKPASSARMLRCG